MFIPDESITTVLVYKIPFGVVAFNEASAMPGDEGSLDVLHADERVWQTFRRGTWREVVIKDARDYPLAWFCATPQPTGDAR